MNMARMLRPALVWATWASAAMFVYVWLCWLARLSEQCAPWWFVGGAVLAAFIVGWLKPSTQRMDDYQAAKHLDDTLGLKDTLSTGFFFAGAVVEHIPMLDLLQAEVESALQKVSDEAGFLSPWTTRSRWLPGVILLLMGSHLYVYPPQQIRLVSEVTVAKTKRELTELEGLLQLSMEDMTEEESEEFEKIRKLISDLRMTDENVSKREILARLSRTIKELEDSEAGGSALMNRALEQLKMSKEAIAAGDLEARFLDMLEETQEELYVVDAASGEKIKAQSIQALALLEKKQKEEEALAKDIQELAKKEIARKEGESVEWMVEGEGAQEKKGEAPTAKKAVTRVKSYEDLALIAEKTDIRTMIFSAAGDASRESRGYREVYSNYRRVMESVLHDELMPVGTKLYVKRYFRAIRPAEAKPKEGGAKKR